MSSKSLFEKALSELEKHNYSNAMYFFKNSLNEFYEESMYYLGYMYELGLGTQDREPNNEQALKCYYEAYSCGLAKAKENFERVYNDLKPMHGYLSSKYPDIITK